MESAAEIKQRMQISAARNILRNKQFRNSDAAAQKKVYNVLVSGGLPRDVLAYLIRENEDEIASQQRIIEQEAKKKEVEQEIEAPIPLSVRDEIIAEGVKSEQTLEYIMGNFQQLPRDVILQLFDDVSLEDLGSICKTSPELREFCTKNKVLEKAAERYLNKNSPLSELDCSAQKRVEWLKRGQVTVYTVVHSSPPVVTMGIEDRRRADNYFSIKGCPPPVGTEVYLLGEESLENYHDDGFALVFHSLSDIVDAYKVPGPRGISQELLIIAEDEDLGFPQGSFDSIPRETMLDFFQAMLDVGTMNRFFLYHVQLP